MVEPAEPPAAAINAAFGRRCFLDIAAELLAGGTIKVRSLARLARARVKMFMYILCAKILR